MIVRPEVFVVDGVVFSTYEKAKAYAAELAILRGGSEVEEPYTALIDELDGARTTQVYGADYRKGTAEPYVWTFKTMRHPDSPSEWGGRRSIAWSAISPDRAVAKLNGELEGGA